MRHQRFKPSPSQLSPAGFNADFSAVAHHHDLLNRSSTAWFDACLCQPTPRGLPSSPSVAGKNRSVGPSFHVTLFEQNGLASGPVRIFAIAMKLPMIRASGSLNSFWLTTFTEARHGSCHGGFLLF